jgi:uncharacterized hydantoinase/oxoprolinase family protein
VGKAGELIRGSGARVRNLKGASASEERADKNFAKEKLSASIILVTINSVWSKIDTIQSTWLEVNRPDLTNSTSFNSVVLASYLRTQILTALSYTAVKFN